MKLDKKQKRFIEIYSTYKKHEAFIMQLTNIKKEETIIRTKENQNKNFKKINYCALKIRKIKHSQALYNGNVIK